MEIKAWINEDVSFIEDFLLKSSKTLFLYSEKYRSLLSMVLESSKSVYFTASENGKVIGYLPSFIKINGKFGNVLNSLPFFGSNGGIVCFDNRRDVKRALLKEFDKFAVENNCAASTIITSPFEKDIEFYENEWDWNCKDFRIGQITFLYEVESGDALLEYLPSKIRNTIKKAVKSNIIVKKENNETGFSFLKGVHYENIKKLNGIEKNKEFFENAYKLFLPDKDYNLFIAYMEGRPIAGMLAFYFNKTVEYFLPAIKEEYRTYQPLSLIIYTAMKEAVERGFKFWNWGGTWESQKGVYQFKSRWRAYDLNYYYYTKIYDKKILELEKEIIMENYKYFFLFPFEKGKCKE